MAIVVVGVSHRGASLDVREKIAYRASDIASVLPRVLGDAFAREAVLLSTCNRTEFYVVEGEGGSDATAAVWTELAARLHGDASPFGYVRRDRDAVDHLYHVASGLDSMVLGEAQIHGQVRDAWEGSRAYSGAVLNRLFQSALSVAGRVRSETTVGRGAASVSSAAVQLSKQIFGSLAGRRAMILGAGEMAELALECLTSEGVLASVVANRTFDRAEELAARYGGTAMHYDDCWAALPTVDLLLCSTASPHAVVTTKHVEPTLRARGDRPLCILDIALPRDVEPAVGDLENVFLYDLDSLQAVIASSLERRRDDLPVAEAMIAGEVDRYWQWMAGLAAVPVLTEVRSTMDRIRSQEVEDALRRLKDLTPEQREQFDQFSKSLMNKFLHEPTVRLRAAAANGRGLGIVDAARYLFGLDPQPSSPPDAVPAPPSSSTSDSDSR
jgi:glutamyl-tRNA reductase